MRRAAVAAAAALALVGCSDGHAPKRPTQKEMADEATVRLWTRALYEGHYDRAAGFFAPGAIIQQYGTRVLRNHREAVAFNRALTCRANVLSIAHEPKGAVVATLNLGPGPGGGCTNGGRVRVRFFIRRGLIETWRQLRERPRLRQATHKSVDPEIATRHGFVAVEGELQRAVGRNLRNYREARGLSQEAFAELIGVHRTYMGGVERGERNLTLKSLERIADRAGIDPLILLRSDAHG